MQRLFHSGEVGQAELGEDDLDVGDRVDLVGDVDHVVVFEAAHHVDDGVRLANVGEELVAQAFTRAGSGHQAGDVHELHDGRHDALGRDDLCELLQARIGHFHHAHVGLDGAEGVVFGGDAGLGQRVEKGGLAHIGQAHDAALEAHGGLSGRSGKPVILAGPPVSAPPLPSRGQRGQSKRQSADTL
ncbi:hypothetical protein D9M68_704240 [compost metagenome]